MLASTSTKFALAVLRNFNSNCCRAQMCDITEKRHRTLTVAIFQFSVGRAHSTERLDAVLDALRHPCALTHSHLVQRMLPCLLETGHPDVECFLLRDYADAH